MALPRPTDVAGSPTTDASTKITTDALIELINAQIDVANKLADQVAALQTFSLDTNANLFQPPSEEKISIPEQRLPGLFPQFKVKPLNVAIAIKKRDEPPQPPSLREQLDTCNDKLNQLAAEAQAKLAALKQFKLFNFLKISKLEKTIAALEEIKSTHKSTITSVEKISPKSTPTSSSTAETSTPPGSSHSARSKSPRSPRSHRNAISKIATSPRLSPKKTVDGNESPRTIPTSPRSEPDSYDGLKEPMVFRSTNSRTLSTDILTKGSSEPRTTTLEELYAYYESQYGSKNPNRIDDDDDIYSFTGYSEKFGIGIATAHSDRARQEDVAGFFTLSDDFEKLTEKQRLAALNQWADDLENATLSSYLINLENFAAEAYVLANNNDRRLYLEANSLIKEFASLPTKERIPKLWQFIYKQEELLLRPTIDAAEQLARDYFNNKTVNSAYMKYASFENALSSMSHLPYERLLDLEEMINTLKYEIRHEKQSLRKMPNKSENEPPHNTLDLKPLHYSSTAIELSKNSRYRLDQGTTFIAQIICGTDLYTINVGDSFAYVTVINAAGKSIEFQRTNILQEPWNPAEVRRLIDAKRWEYLDRHQVYFNPDGTKQLRFNRQNGLAMTGSFGDQTNKFNGQLSGKADSGILHTPTITHQRFPFPRKDWQFVFTVASDGLNPQNLFEESEAEAELYQYNILKTPQPDPGKSISIESRIQKNGHRNAQFISTDLVETALTWGIAGERDNATVVTIKKSGAELSAPANERKTTCIYVFDAHGGPDHAHRLSKLAYPLLTDAIKAQQKLVNERAAISSTGLFKEPKTPKGKTIDDLPKPKHFEPARIRRSSI